MEMEMRDKRRGRLRLYGLSNEVLPLAWGKICSMKRVSELPDFEENSKKENKKKGMETI